MAGKRRITLIVVIVLVILIIAIGFVVYSQFYKSVKVRTSPNIKNPVEGLTDERAVEEFNEDFIVYLLIGIGADNLHNPPFSSNTPELLFYVGEDVYNAEIVDGKVYVRKTEISEPDIVITTTKIEGVKMLRDIEYVKQSFLSGNLQIDFVASKKELFAKGYLKIYKQFYS